MPRILIKDLDSTEKGMGSDMNLYFNGTIVKVSKDGKTSEWVKFNGFTNEGHYFVNSKGDTYHINSGEHPNAYIEWMFPTGWFNTKKSAIYFERIPKRQYLKGIQNNGNFRMTTAESIAKECGLLKASKDSTPEMQEILSCISEEAKVHFNVELLKSALEGYPTYEDAYILMKSRKVFSRALSADLSLLPHPKTKDFVVMCHDFPVAELLTKNKVQMLVSEFKPECLSYFQHQGVSVVS